MAAVCFGFGGRFCEVFTQNTISVVLGMEGVTVERRGLVFRVSGGRGILGCPIHTRTLTYFIFSRKNLFEIVFSGI